ncbi:hypothetical protein CDL15_Pgr023361 [Punica granatum]|uniref:Uncharacterized protein n=1 Tax=Punica granatum TaxID=22663 RepID=A0A218Y1U0_PUNGR|nr:hypothetical protein CDL15_Pgr023361 [Punica granatum]
MAPSLADEIASKVPSSYVTEPRRLLDLGLSKPLVNGMGRYGLRYCSGSSRPR